MLKHALLLPLGFCSSCPPLTISPQKTLISHRPSLNMQHHPFSSPNTFILRESPWHRLRHAFCVKAATFSFTLLYSSLISRIETQWRPGVTQ
ncbi:hypothetical protein KUCAC02_024212 [Chaenocephalus aceratus]|uniref:Uncharacterized protein n=1 Tax=Chaenocephalus aceratus TaxID=36190 RepID=A0ACB9WH62_CHAAC|nr:hypothetical protein KUCAC02_024212 [Chaenocephalus aceratus]